MANHSVQLSDEMAAALGLDAGDEHTRDAIGAAVQDRFGASGARSVEGLESLPVHVLGELVVLLDAGGCLDLDAAVRTATEGADADGTIARAVAEDICGEVAERHHMP